MSAIVNSTAPARYFDGATSQAHAARLQVQDDRLTVEPRDGADFEPFALPFAKVRWPERTRHGGRIAQLPGGASLHATDVHGWDEWMTACKPDGWVVRAQQSWRGVLIAMLGLFVVLAALYEFGLPVIAKFAAEQVPWHVEAAIGERTLESLEGRLLHPSALSPEDQQRLRSDFEAMVRASHGDAAIPWKLIFRRGADALGPNAMALPGGTIVLTDELVQLMPDHPRAVLAVLAHEFGHVQQRHSMRQIAQVSAMGVLATVIFGDFSVLAGGAPATLATLGYSRDLEREADAEALRMLRAAGIPPRAMVDFFEAAQAWHSKRDAGATGEPLLGLALASHPATAERIAFFGNAEAN